MSHDVHQARRLSTRYAAPPSGLSLMGSQRAQPHPTRIEAADQRSPRIYSLTFEAVLHYFTAAPTGGRIDNSILSVDVVLTGLVGQAVRYRPLDAKVRPLASKPIAVATIWASAL
jgi:hypothetical protein